MSAFFYLVSPFESFASILAPLSSSRSTEALGFCKSSKYNMLHVAFTDPIHVNVRRDVLSISFKKIQVPS
jgi:hypothetical protein